MLFLGTSIIALVECDHSWGEWKIDRAATDNKHRQAHTHLLKMRNITNKELLPEGNSVQRRQKQDERNKGNAEQAFGYGLFRWKSERKL